MLHEFHDMDSPFNTGMLGGSMLQSVPLDRVLTFLAAIKWVKVDSARPWSPGGTVSLEVVEAQQVKVDQIYDLTLSNYPDALQSVLESDGLNPLKFGRIGSSYSINFDQLDATILSVGANDPRRWRYLAALATCWKALDTQSIEGDNSSTNEFDGLSNLVTNASNSAGTSAANTRSDVAKALANVASAGKGATALIGNAEVQRLFTEAFDGGRTEYGPGPSGGLIPFFDKVPFLRANVAISTNLTSFYAVDLQSLVMFHTSGSKETLGFELHSTDEIAGSAPRAAETENVVYGGHALNICNESAVYAINAVDVSSYT